MNPAGTNAQRELISRALAEHLPVGPATEPGLRAAVEAAISRPGGLVRPLLAWETGRAAGLAEPLARRLACATEYFHTASLLLDDLPCMDDARERRGQPCTHLVHGEATAILAALALINRAHTLAGGVLAFLPADRRLSGQLCLDACLGSGGLLDGQARDLAYHRTAGGAVAVSQIARRKTGALFQLSLLLPALAGELDQWEWSGLGRLSLYWGLAYQAADDLTDILGPSADTGKTTGRDRERQRPNLALALGVAAARHRLARQVRQAERTVARLAGGHPRWAYLVQFQERLAGLAAPLALAA